MPVQQDVRAAHLRVGRTGDDGHRQRARSGAEGGGEGVGAFAVGKQRFAVADNLTKRLGSGEGEAGDVGVDQLAVFVVAVDYRRILAVAGQHLSPVGEAD